MSERPAPYFVRPALDACLQPQHLPAKPSLDVYKSRSPEWRRDVMERVIEVAFPRVVEHLCLAPETWEAEGRRGVWLWGLLEISVAADGANLRLDRLGHDPDVEPCPAAANLVRPINRFSFSAAMSPLLVAAARECGLPPTAVHGPAGAYIRSVFARTFNRCVDWNRLRRSVLGHLRLDPLVVSLTRRAFEDCIASPASFNWVARHVRELALVAAEHPRLLPFLQLVSIVDGPPVESFELAVRAAGITPSARRKLERWGFEPFSLASGCMRGDPIDAVADFANLLDRLGIHEPPHPFFVELALSDSLASPPDWFLRTLHKEIEILADEIDDPFPLDCELVAAWINSKPPLPDPHQQQSWTWITEQAWQYRALTDAAASEAWAVPSGTLSIAGYELVPLRCALDLRAEAECMRNCLATYEDDCRAGKLAVYSIRMGARRVASLALCRVKNGDGLWQVMQVAGKGNRTAPEMAEVAMAVVRLLVREVPAAVEVAQPDLAGGTSHPE